VTVTINFEPYPSAGYTPRKSLTLHNVAAVQDHGVRMIRVRMIFSDSAPTYDHVVSIVAVPSKPE
jgi:hypothetical protein